MTCPTCGAVADEFIRIEANYTCTECGSTLDGVDVVPKDDLRALVAEWRERSERQQTPEEWATFGECADDLEELL